MLQKTVTLASSYTPKIETLWPQNLIGSKFLSGPEHLEYPVPVGAAIKLPTLISF